MGGLFRRWVVYASVGEVAGFLVPTAAQVVFANSHSSALYSAMIVAGMFEGGMLGIAQWLVMRRVLPAVSAPRWIVFTALAAALAWAIGLAPTTFDGWLDWPMAFQVVMLGAGGVVLLTVIGAAQWIELRRHVANAWLWVFGTAAAWLVGLAVFFAVATPLWQEGQPVALVVVIGVVAAALMALGMATVTGVALVRLMGGRHAAPG